jgi:hypothetical protein
MPNLMTDFRVIRVETVPAEVYRYLLPNERRVITVRRHPVVLAPALGLLMVNVTAFALSAADVIQGGTALLAGLGILFPASCYIFYRTKRAWCRAYIVATTARIMLVNLVWKHPLLVIPLDEAYDMTYVYTRPFGWLIGYGSFVFKKSETLRRTLKLRYLPYPEQLYIEVAGLLFPGDRDYRVTRPRSA